MKRRPAKNADPRRNTRNSPDQAELARIVGASESIRGFARQPQRKWDRGPRVCQKCGGDGSYLDAGVLRMCACGGRS